MTEERSEESSPNPLNRIIPVDCSSVDELYISFVCPYCRTRYKKDGTPYKNSKAVTHYHGSGGKTVNGSYGTKGPHCDALGKNVAIKQGVDPDYVFQLTVNDATKRKKVDGNGVSKYRNNI